MRFFVSQQVDRLTSSSNFREVQPEFRENPRAAVRPYPLSAVSNTAAVRTSFSLRAWLYWRSVMLGFKWALGMSGGLCNVRDVATMYIRYVDTSKEVPVLTKVATWGNSAAVRLPKRVLRQAGIASGDSVRVLVRDDGHIDISGFAKPSAEHRHVTPESGITFESLTANWSGDPRLATEVWDEEFVGAEAKAWQR